MATRSQMTDVQKRVQRNLDAAMDTCVKYAAPEVPPLENYTPQGLSEELGRVNAAKKQIEKVEKILKERWKVLRGAENVIRSDNFEVSITGKPRYALNQTKAKEKLQAFGCLDECMEDSVVETITCKELDR